MKRFIFLLTVIFMCTIARSDEITINWMNTDRTINHTTTCTIGGDVILPQTPYKYGYTFNGWGANYIPIEYLENTGTQYIDTGAKISDASFSVKLLIDFLPFSAEGYMGYNGCSQLRISNLTSGVRQTAYSLCSSNGITINVVNDVLKESGNFGWGGSSLWLFQENGYPTRSKGYLYTAQVYIDDILVRDFIPVLDNSGVPCMYDLVEGKFYYNAGTGQFIAGPVIGE